MTTIIGLAITFVIVCLLFRGIAWLFGGVNEAQARTEADLIAGDGGSAYSFYEDTPTLPEYDPQEHSEEMRKLQAEAKIEHAYDQRYSDVERWIKEVTNG